MLKERLLCKTKAYHRERMGYVVISKTDKTLGFLFSQAKDNGFLFMQDRAFPHTAKLTHEMLKEKELWLLESHLK